MESRKGERPATGSDWNVVVTLPERTFREACKLLGKWGLVKRTAYYNVLTMKVNDPQKFLDEFSEAVAHSPGLLNYVSHVVPAQRSFDFEDRKDFDAQAREIILGWARRLVGKTFCIRLHRRGLRSELSSHSQEQTLGETLLSALGNAGRVVFDDPDALIEIETVGKRAGMSLWTRDDLRAHPFLGKP
jgi:tRNA(Ser,Leu) C12 N-acetylase TAN1